jgi:hypothetical protein
LRWTIAVNLVLPYATYPAVAGIGSVQRLIKSQNPRSAEVNVDDLVDNRDIGKLNESGFLFESMADEQSLSRSRILNIEKKYLTITSTRPKPSTFS